MYQPGTKVRLKVDHSKIGIIASVVAYEPVVSYLVFHDASDTETMKWKETQKQKTVAEMASVSELFTMNHVFSVRAMKIQECWRL